MRTKVLLPVVCVALAVVAGARAAAPPPQLVGTWTRTVSATDVARAKSTRIKAGSTWTLVVTTHKASLRSTGVAGYTGAIVPATATLVNVELGGDKANLYAWRRAGNTLVLSKKHDPNADLAAVLAGTWKRR